MDGVFTDDAQVTQLVNIIELFDPSKGALGMSAAGSQASREAGTTLPRAVHDGAGLGLEWKWVPPDAAVGQGAPQVAGQVSSSQLARNVKELDRSVDATGEVTGQVTPQVGHCSLLRTLAGHSAGRSSVRPLS